MDTITEQACLTTAEGSLASLTAVPREDHTNRAALGLEPAVPLRMVILLSASVPLPLPVSLAPLPQLPDDLY